MLKQDTVWALGAMSGTSLDGVDAAMLKTDGYRILEFGKSRYRAYDEVERETLTAALGKWPGEEGVAAAAQVIEAAHIDLMSEFQGADIIGFHGQTLAHDPRGRGTHQVGNGAVLADQLGCRVVGDFRSADVELGGEGAPLAPFFHHACARWMDWNGAVAFLNLGGVGNLTWVDARVERPEEPGALLAFDTGPANAPINDLMMARRGLACDKGGELAATGQVNKRVVTGVLRRKFFRKIPPKSLDRNDFHDLMGKVEKLNDADAVATLTAIAAASAAQGIEHCPKPPEALLVTGGGRCNPVLMAMLADRVDCPVLPVEEVGLDGDMLEAQAFGYLAVRVAKGLPTSAPGTTGVRAAVGGGQVFTPGQVAQG